MREFIELEYAQDIILALVAPDVLETISLEEALGRVMADAYVAEINIPPFDRSPLDGYAIWGEDTLESLPVKLKLIGEIPAGQNFSGGLNRGEAVQILTGSPLPAGANAVIRQEDTVETEGYVHINRRVLPGESISLRGEDIKRGDIFPGGFALTPAAIGILASQGQSHVRVHRKPVVSLISTGDELVL
ncbi:MAG TPA: molybdopterin molybdenumtransferase MoeA, partial [Verrucomicrobiae bacterium]|nr:molybdopterin molybdenumtransferase MoeA [Verrucomicrobiae bacterium]